MYLSRFAALLFAIAAIVSACSSGEASKNAVADPTESAEVPEPTATPTTSDLTPSPTSEAPVALDPAGATDAWLTMWEGVEEVVTDPESAQSTIGAVATDSVFDQLDTIYNPSVDSGVGNSPRAFANNPVASEQADGSVVIDDCMFEAPKVGNATIWYSGTVRAINGQWKVESLTLTSEIGCVPATVAQEAIDGYEAYWDARVAFWDPADPTSQLVAATTTGSHRTLLEGLLADHLSRGLALRGRPATNPEIIEVRSPSQIAMLDCKLQTATRGLFVVSTGERLGDIPEIAPGQRDLSSAVMILEEGVWRVSDVQGQADVSCDTAPTPQGLPVV